jgi:hypothetical protein
VAFTLSRPGTAIRYALILLVAAFAWGGFVANVPSLRDVGGVPYVVHNPVVALPILATWTGLGWLLARRYLARVREPSREGVSLGVLFLAFAVAFDVVVVAVIVGEGVEHFGQLVVWLGYAVLVAIPTWVGRRLTGPTGTRRRPSRPMT